MLLKQADTRQEAWSKNAQRVTILAKCFKREAKRMQQGKARPEMMLPSQGATRESLRERFD